MSRIYSIDLREKVVSFVQAGHYKVEAANIFNIHLATIAAWMKNLKYDSNLKHKIPIIKERKIDFTKLAAAVIKKSCLFGK